MSGLCFGDSLTPQTPIAANPPLTNKKLASFLQSVESAKSSWNNPGLDDHDRPLNKRGRQTAETIAAYFRQAKIAPDLVICSTAVRARQTLGPIAKARKPPNVVIQRGIYEGMRQTM